VNRFASPGVLVASTLVVLFVASVMFYLAMSGEPNPHTAPSASAPAQSTGSR